VLASLLRVFVASFTMLALSSLSKSSRYVAVLFTGACSSPSRCSPSCVW
jgi:hypothetical protein